MARILFLLPLVGLLAGCHTVSGVGEDAAAAGRWLTGVARTDTRAPSTASGTSNPSSVNAETVKRAQSALRSQGLYNGPIDGIVGDDTRSAVMKYQQSKGLPQTGELDSTTLHDLTSQS